jgi:hypothetical protein
MALQMKDLDYPLPHGLTLEGFMDGDAFDVRSFDAVQLANHVCEFFDNGQGCSFGFGCAISNRTTNGALSP